MEPVSQRPLDTLSPDEMCMLARDPSQATRLEEYLGSDHYRELSTAVRGPARAAPRAAKGTVVLLHGIMGSQIGKAKARDGSWDIVWLNPLAICAGDMKNLRLGAGKSRYGARGLLPMFYSMLWARLKFWYGFNLLEFAYDWRLGIQDSAKQLVSFLEEETSGPVSLVAHSMGGLVARAALPLLGNRGLDGRVERVVQLASPNYGSFQPVLTLRGLNEFVNRVLALDGDPLDDLISDVVATFQGLHELMPAPARFSAVDLFDAAIWPVAPRVDAAVLAKAKEAIGRLPPPDARFVLIAGTNQATVTGMSHDGPGGEFYFSQTDEGDGTVPLDLARFDASANVPTYLANVTHNGIVLDAKVAEAVNDLLTTGETECLPVDSRARSRRPAPPRALDVGRARNPFDGRRCEAISTAEVRQAQREVLGPLQAAGGSLTGGLGTPAAGGGGAGGDQGFNGVVVSRRRRRLRLTLAHGDITRVPAHAHVIGVFEGVTPVGPAAEYNDLLGGAVNDLFARRMFSAARGSVYMLPTYKTAVPGEVLVFAGLGSFQDFNTGVVEDVAAQVVQSLLRVRAAELAAVVFGGSSTGASQNLEAMLRGLITGLEQADHDYDFRRVVLCELDADKYAALKAELYRLASLSLFDKVEVEFDTIELPAVEAAARRTEPVVLPPQQPVYLISNLLVNPHGGGADTVYQHEISVLPPSSGTTFPRFVRKFPKRDLDEFLRKVARGAPDDLDDFGARLAKLVLPDELAGQSRLVTDQSVQLLHDAMASRIPWEAVKFGDAWPVVAKGFSRKYQRNRSAAMFSNAQRWSDALKVLLVYDPTEDLEGAKKEGEAVLSVAAGSGGKIEVTPLRGREATRDAILARLGGDDFDVLHYAGHAGYVAENPSQSGLLCADRHILSGRELEPLGARLPPVIVLNACESGRVRRARPDDEIESGPASAAEAILNAGIVCFIATFWPVSDSGAGLFAGVFYDRLLSGLKPGAEAVTMGAAVLAARQSLREKAENDWANYMLYGNPDFVLKEGRGVGRVPR